MNIINRIDGVFALNKNKTKTKSPVSKVPNILFNIPRPSFSDDTNNTLSSSGSFQQTLEDTKRSIKVKEIPVLKQNIQEVEFQQINNAKNNLNGNPQKNKTTKKKEREPPQHQLRKVENLVPLKSGHSDEKLEKKPGKRYIDEDVCLKKDQDEQNMNGRNQQKEGNFLQKKSIEAGDLFKRAYQAQRKDDKKINHKVDERKIFKQEEVRGLKSIEFSDISETQSLICNSDGTLPQTTKLAFESLKDFPLDQLIKTKDNHFDMRHKTTQEYFDLCGKADCDPLVYYKQNCKQVVFEFEKKKVPYLRNDEVQGKIPSKRASSLRLNNELRKLQIFPLEELKMTKKGFFDKRYKLTQTYLDLCEKADKNPFKYYHENLEKMIPNRGESDISQRKLKKSSSLEALMDIKEKSPTVLALKKLKEFALDELKITKKGFFDQRFKLTHAYLELCQEANKDPVVYYKENIKQ